MLVEKPGMPPRQARDGNGYSDAARRALACKDVLCLQRQNSVASEIVEGRRLIAEVLHSRRLDGQQYSCGGAKLNMPMVCKQFNKALQCCR